MEKINRITDTAVPLAVDNIDTDQIIPARFLKATTREGFGEHLFADWRYEGGAQLNVDFPLNQDQYTGKILVAGHNFGCGSSREHAAWALYDYGFRVVLSSEFADIFKTNALNNGILPITVSEDFLDEFFQTVKEDPKAIIDINLANQTVRFGHREQAFEINPFMKKCLMEGKTEFDFLLDSLTEVKEYETTSVYEYYNLN